MRQPVDEQREAGASSVEYALIVFAIAALIVVIIFALGRVVAETHSDSCDAIAQEAQGTDCPV